MKGNLVGSSIFLFSKKYVRIIEKFQSISNFACVIMRKKGKRRIGYKLIGRLQQTVQSMFEQESAQIENTHAFARV